MRTKEQLIEELSIKEILDELCSANNKYVVGIEASPEYRETYRRLEAGEKAIEMVKLQTEIISKLTSKDIKKSMPEQFGIARVC